MIVPGAIAIAVALFGLVGLNSPFSTMPYLASRPSVARNRFHSVFHRLCPLSGLNSRRCSAASTDASQTIATTSRSTTSKPSAGRD